MKTMTFSVRNAKEILRDPLTICFSLGFPVVLLLLLSAIQANIPVSLFEIESLAPGIGVFGLSFMTLFSATLIAKDRESAFLQRLYTTPMSAVDFLFGYMIPILPISAAQSAVTYLIAILLGLKPTVNILFCILFTLPISVLFIAVGLLCGSVMGVKQVGGICGALFTNVSAFLSGIWFDISLVGGVFEKAAHGLPFIHAVELERAVLSGDFGEILPHLSVVMLYSSVILIIAILLFLRQMKRN